MQHSDSSTVGFVADDDWCKIIGKLLIVAASSPVGRGWWRPACEVRGGGGGRGGGGKVVEAADPAGVEEEESDEEDDGKEDDDEEAGAASDFEVPVVEFGVVPVEWL
ncbi:hypothetical protein L1049_012189 [Liquidambar formosana]|uniref:Uncharacterized protein n=1 Tax=Liquidambar formosana TaxID=63359 RepID=A0AAP0RSQ5_LIQFO